MSFRINSTLNPILLRGHERSITTVRFNEDGDLLFTSAKDSTPTVWNARTGERLGTYEGHNGVVWDIDPSWDSRFLLTASGDQTAVIWEVATGRRIAKIEHNGPVRGAKWAEGGRMFVTARDSFNASRENASIRIYRFDEDNFEENDPPAASIEMPPIVKATALDWTLCNRHIVACFDNGRVALYDPETAKEVQSAHVHSDRIQSLSFNKEKCFAVTASRDHTAKLLNLKDLSEVKVYQTERPVNAAVISPLKYHVLLGGGQDAMSVATAARSQGKFETRFFHMIYQEEFGRVPGHFGPINALAIHPTGRSYASGAEDGYIRLHHFDNNYLQMDDQIPSSEELQEDPEEGDAQGEGEEYS